MTPNMTLACPAYLHGFEIDGKTVDFINPASWGDSMTEQEVLNWCWANGVDKDATEANLAASIELQKNPVVASGVPWATNALQPSL